MIQELNIPEIESENLVRHPEKKALKNVVTHIGTLELVEPVMVVNTNAVSDCSPTLPKINILPYSLLAKNLKLNLVHF